jgi:hypothetical protein
MRLRGLIAAVPAIGVVVAPLLLAVAACSASLPCAGQCGPPFQLQVTFRAGTSRPAAAAAMNECAGSSLVERIGRPSAVRRPGRGWPALLRAVVYTRSMTRQKANQQLLACLHRSASVRSAGYPD